MGQTQRAESCSCLCRGLRASSGHYTQAGRRDTCSCLRHPEPVQDPRPLEYELTPAPASAGDPQPAQDTIPRQGDGAPAPVPAGDPGPGQDPRLLKAELIPALALAPAGHQEPSWSPHPCRECQVQNSSLHQLPNHSVHLLLYCIFS